MSENKKNIKQEKLRSTFEKIDKIHPHKMLMYLFIFGSSMVFLFMLLAYSVSDANIGDYEMPKAFIVSAMVMLVSSFAVSRIIPAFQEERIYKVRNSLVLTLSLALIFSFSQYMGWQNLKMDGIFLEGRSEAIYLYAISGLHLALFMLALAFLSIILIDSIKASNDPVKVLIKITNPYEKVRLQMLNIYWQYMNGLWLVLFFYFLFRF